jgi:lysophospholipase L1-like esterase
MPSLGLGLSTTRGTSPALAFTPFDLESLTLWWSFRDAATTLKTGDVPAGDGEAIIKQLDLVSGTQIANASGPTLDVDAGPGGVRAAAWNGTSNVLNTTTDIIPDVSTCIMMVKPLSHTTNDRFWDTASSGGRSCVFQTADGQLVGNGGVPAGVRAITNKWTIVTAIHNGTAVQLRLDGDPAVSGTASGAAVPVRFNLGATGSTAPASGYAHMQVTDIMFFNAVLSDADQKKVREYLYAQTARTYLPQIVCDGNSLTAGVGAGAGESYPEQMLTLYGTTNMTVKDYGVGGQTTRDMIADADTEIDPQFNSERVDNILVAWEILNDWAVSTGTDSQTPTVASQLTVDRLWEYCDARKAAGWKVVILTVLPANYSVGQVLFDAQRATVNTRIREEWHLHADAMADVADDPDIGVSEAYLNPAFFDEDEVHLNAAGYAKVAAIVKTAIDTLI